MIRGFSHIAVRVTDIERSLAFYCGILGLAEKFRTVDPDGNQVEFHQFTPESRQVTG